ncbi:MAG: RING finger protein [Planctomycetota bacterium]|jgi:hypothetical protein
MEAETPRAATAGTGTALCAVCQSAISSGEATTVCPECRAPYHAECWQENGGCGVYGCSRVPETQPRDELEMPVSYWGQERKPCPNCGADILAAAVRCRQCGSTFESARPASRREFRQQKETEAGLPRARKVVVWLLVLCVLPFTAPIGALFGLFWLPIHRRELRALPSAYAGVGKIALMLGIGQTLVLVAAGVLYTFFRTTALPAVSRDTDIFGPEERARLTALREVFAPEGEGVGMRWRAGAKVPFTFALDEKDEEERREVFAFGQWCSPSMRDLKARTAKAVGHKPREVDVSEFSVWMSDRELAYLRSRAKPFGRSGPGEARAEDVKALVAALECAGRAGVVGGLEHSTVMRTTFSPRRRGEGPTVFGLDTSAREAPLVLLRDPASWPADEVLLSPVPEEQSGFDFRAVMRTVRASPQDLTLYYRIRSYQREAVGRGSAAKTNVLLSAQVLAATLGPERKPTKVWLRQAFKD